MDRPLGIRKRLLSCMRACSYKPNRPPHLQGSGCGISEYRVSQKGFENEVVKCSAAQLKHISAGYSGNLARNLGTTDGLRRYYMGVSIEVCKIIPACLNFRGRGYSSASRSKLPKPAIFGKIG